MKQFKTKNYFHQSLTKHFFPSIPNIVSFSMSDNKLEGEFVAGARFLREGGGGPFIAIYDCYYSKFF